MSARATVAGMRDRILNATVALADRLETSASDRFTREMTDLLEARSEHNFHRAIGSSQFAVSLALRLVARRLGRPSFSPLMAWAQGLDDEALRAAQTQGDA